MIREKIKILKSAVISPSNLLISLSFSQLFSQRFSTVDAPDYLNIVSVNKQIAECSKSGDLVTAQKLFDEMPRRDVVSWNSLMAGYSHNCCSNHVLKLFSDMWLHGFKPNYTSFSTVFSACGDLKALIPGQQIHGFSFKMGSTSNVFVGTSLIKMYANCKIYGCLNLIFEGIENPNIASWNALISGFVLNRQMGDACQVFNHMPMRNVITWTAMIKGYIETNNLNIALELFNSLPVKNLVSWCVVVGGFVSHERFEEAVRLFVEMTRCGDKGNHVILNKAISAFSGLKNIKGGRNIHAYAMKLGLHGDHIIEASLVAMYCECLDIEEARLEFDKLESKYIGSWNVLLNGFIKHRNVGEARKVFNSMVERDHISWNSLINGYLKENCIDEAIKLFEQMPEPTIETNTAIMSSLLENGLLKDAENLFLSMPKVDVVACTTMLSGYLKEGLLDRAQNLFDKMTERSSVTCNVMISGMLQFGKIKEAYRIFNESPKHDNTTWHLLITGLVQNGLINRAFLLYKNMVFSNFKPNESVIASLISSSIRLRKLLHGEQFHTVTIKFGITSRLLVQNSLINLYSKFGEMGSAREVFDGMKNKDVVTWNSIIFGYAVNCQGKDALKVFDEMMGLSVRPDHVTLLGILYACAHSDLLEEARNLFNRMEGDFRVVPELAHYSCMVELFTKKGLVGEAQRLVDSMHFKPDQVVWTSILNGYKMKFDRNLGIDAANRLIDCNQSDKMPHLHLLSMLRSAGRGDLVEVIRSKMEKVKLRKKPGLSWI